jgi:hypothetical protein
MSIHGHTGAWPHSKEIAVVKLHVITLAVAAFTTGQAEAFASDAPKRDARGIQVVSNPVSAPAGFNGQIPDGNASARGCITCGGTGGTTTSVPTTSGGTVPKGSPMVTVNYPPCTRAVTDGCVQAYERRVVARH